MGSDICNPDADPDGSATTRQHGKHNGEDPQQEFFFWIQCIANIVMLGTDGPMFVINSNTVTKEFAVADKSSFSN